MGPKSLRNRYDRRGSVVALSKDDARMPLKGSRAVTRC